LPIFDLIVVEYALHVLPPQNPKLNNSDQTDTAILDLNRP